MHAQSTAEVVVPDTIRNYVLNEYFSDHAVYQVLMERYQTITYTLVILILLTILLVRRYGRQVTESQARLFDAMKYDSVMLFDRDGDLRKMNRSARILLGLDESVQRFKRLRQVVPVYIQS
jgi:PAS domain-containing protein